MIFYNSENSIRNIRPVCRPLFCHSSGVQYTSSYSSEVVMRLDYQILLKSSPPLTLLIGSFLLHYDAPSAVVRSLFAMTLSCYQVLGLRCNAGPLLTCCVFLLFLLAGLLSQQGLYRKCGNLLIALLEVMFKASAVVGLVCYFGCNFAVQTQWMPISFSGQQAQSMYICIFQPLSTSVNETSLSTVYWY